MSGFDFEDVLKAVQERGPSAPQVRIYLLSEGDPPTARLSAALADYEIVVPHSRTEAAFLRKMAVESEEQFRREGERVAAIIAPLLVADSYVCCVYDNHEGYTQFRMDMQKTAGTPKFIEVDPAPDSGR